MPYNLSFFDGRAFITLADGVVDQQASSSLYLIGKDVTSYGTIQNDNFLWLLENFAGTVEPVNKVQGQIWFDKSSTVLKPKIYDGGEWRTFGLTTAGESSSTNATSGDLWFDTSKNQLFVKNTSSSYTLVGPEAVPGFGRTRFSSRSVLDTGNNLHACIVMYVDGSILGAVSNDEFFVNTADEIYLAGIEFIGRGFNFVSGASVSTDDEYLTATQNATITGRWAFTSINGIGIGTSTIFSSESGNLTLQSLGRSVVINANELRPSGSTVTLGSSSNKFAKVYASEINAGSSVSSANLVGKFILAASSKLEPGTDSSISLGAANARFSTLFSKGLNSGGTNEEGIITGAWKLNPGSTLDVSNGNFIVSNILSPLVTSPIIDANTVTALINVITPTVNASSVVNTPKLSAGSTLATGQFEGQWIFTPGSSITLPAGTRSYYADIAERYTSDQQYESGTVVMFGGEQEVTIANIPTTTKVAGIITTDPAQILNSDLENSVAIALVGRVPCKVTGAIFKGDMLVVSRIPGVLTSAAVPKPGAIVAKAMEFYNSNEIGVIEVMVTRG
jgi:hypothetical protein